MFFHPNLQITVLCLSHGVSAIFYDQTFSLLCYVFALLPLIQTGIHEL